MKKIIKTLSLLLMSSMVSVDLIRADDPPAGEASQGYKKGHRGGGNGGREGRHSEGRAMSPAFKEGQKIRGDFVKLQESAGLKPLETKGRRVQSDEEKESRMQRHEAMNKLRSSLNQMLSGKVIDEKAVEAKIKELESMKPMRSPKGSDYRELLSAKLKK